MRIRHSLSCVQTSPPLEKIVRGDVCTQASKKYFQCCNDDIISAL